MDVVPSFSAATDTVTISNREYIRDLYCPLQLNSFQIVDELHLNPGLSNTFPWLSQVAQNFEEYEFQQLIVTFKSTIDQSLATNGQSGQVALTTSYNADSSPFGSKQEMMAYSGGMSAKTNQSMIHGVECDPAKNSGSAGKYIRPGLVGTDELKDYDLGTTYVSVLDAPQQFLGQTLGELWISYTVVLRKPKLSVAENYGVDRTLVCIEKAVWPGYFGVEGDNLLQIASKRTLPCEFIRPLTNSTANVMATGPAYDNLMYNVPTPFAGIESFVGTGVFLNAMQWLEIRFLPSFSGIVEVRVLVKQVIATLPPPAFTKVDTINFIQAACTGQIFRFKDIPGNDQSIINSSSAPYTPCWSHVMNMSGAMEGGGSTTGPALANQGTSYEFDSQQLILHLRVMPVLAGVNNSIFIGGLLSQLNCAFAHCEISGINTYLSFDDAPINPSKNKMPLEVYSSPGVVATYP